MGMTTYESYCSNLAAEKVLCSSWEFELGRGGRIALSNEEVTKGAGRYGQPKYIKFLFFHNH
jgi:hypothetical protein